MDERLLDYALGQLDPTAIAPLEAELATNPDLLARLALLRRALAPLDAVAAASPPAGLAERTLARVAVEAGTPLPKAPTERLRGGEAPGWAAGWWVQWVLAASILVLVGGLATVGLSKAWAQSNVTACQQNLNEIWHALAVYGQQHDGALPAVAEKPGPAGVAGGYVPALYACGAAPEGLNVGCAAVGKKVAPQLSLASLEQMHREDPDRFAKQMRALGGDYAYTLGFRQDGRLCGPRLDAGDAVPLLCDAPSVKGDGNSPNHGGRGQNVLFAGGQVRWLPTAAIGPDRDAIYYNRAWQVRPGLDPKDFVLGAGDACAGP